jgi:hypothetical protein
MTFFFIAFNLTSFLFPLFFIFAYDLHRILRLLVE